MTEFALASALLVLMLLGLWTIGSYQELQRRAIVAARQGSFELAWLGGRVSQDATRDRLASMHFGDPALISATGRSRLAEPESMSLEAQSGSAPGEGTAAMELLLAPFRSVGGFLGSGFDLRNEGFRSGSIIVSALPVSDLPLPFRDLELEFRQPFALLSDAWNASGPSHVAERAGGLVPSHILAGVADLWRGLSAPLGLVEPSLRQFCPGLIEPDRVPEDRLGPGRVQPDASCP